MSQRSDRSEEEEDPAFALDSLLESTTEEELLFPTPQQPRRITFGRDSILTTQQESSNSSSSSSSSTSTNSSNQGIQATMSTTPRTKQETIGGMKIEIFDTPQAIDRTHSQKSTRALRSAMAGKDLNQLAELITKLKISSQEYEVPSDTITSTDQLTEVVELEAQIQNTLEGLTIWGLNDVFNNIISYQKADPIKGTAKDMTSNLSSKDLFQEYQSMTPKEVGESNEWYRMMPKDRALYGWDLQISKEWLVNNTSPIRECGLESNDDVDPCLFISDKVICLVYVDDTLFFSPKREYIDEVVKGLRDRDMELEEEESVAGFLGVDLQDRRNEDGTIRLTQSGLSKRIISALNIDHLPKKYTPAIREPVVKDEFGDPPQGTFNYASVIGMLQYLQGHSRPDITFAVSQCARFVHSPRRSHEIALERIGQYLKATIEEGLIFRPNKELVIDCYVDSDFAGLWPYEDKQDSTCVKSRMGYVITIANCPLVWKSALIPDIALSTMEAEYSALSIAMKTTIPLLRIVKSIGDRIEILRDKLTTFKTTIHEDNAGALTLANLEPGRMTPRSKHYAVKYHWFRSHLKPNSVTVQKIDTTQQKADILTKGLNKQTFESIRRLLCGW